MMTMRKNSAFAALATLVALAAPTLAPAATYSWVENNNLQSTLDANFTYSATTNQIRYDFINQTFTNTGPALADAGMYIGWAWAATYAAAHASDWSGYTPLVWDNARQAFYNADFGGTGTDISLQVQGSGYTASVLSLATVGDPTGTNSGWTGTPYSYAPGAPAITTSSSMNVPFLDFGAMAAGETRTYNLTLTFSFSNPPANFNQDFVDDFYVSGQGVSAVPLPTAASAGTASLGALLLRRARRK